MVVVVQTILTAGSQLLSDDHVTSWQDLTSSGQLETVSHLVSAVETSSFMRADLSQSPTIILADYSNIGKRQKMLSFYLYVDH